jgi:hypothetical protein
MHIQYDISMQQEQPSTQKDTDFSSPPLVLL